LTNLRKFNAIETVNVTAKNDVTQLYVWSIAIDYLIDADILYLETRGKST